MNNIVDTAPDKTPVGELACGDKIGTNAGASRHRAVGQSVRLCPPCREAAAEHSRNLTAAIDPRKIETVVAGLASVPLTRNETLVARSPTRPAGPVRRTDRRADRPPPTHRHPVPPEATQPRPTPRVPHPHHTPHGPAQPERPTGRSPGPRRRRRQVGGRLMDDDFYGGSDPAKCTHEMEVAVRFILDRRPEAARDGGDNA